MSAGSELVLWLWEPGVDSYTRAPRLLSAYPAEGCRLEWFSAAGEVWSCCDNIGAHRSEFARVLKSATRAELDAMMSALELERLASLPPMLTVYRSCYAFNLRGLSWSLNRDVAIKFTALQRYKRNGWDPVLLTGRVSRSRAVLKLDRLEEEVIAPSVRVIATEAIEFPAMAG